MNSYMNSTMRGLSILLFGIMLHLTIQAQQTDPEHHGKKYPDVSQLVDDLSANQKRKIDVIGRDSRERVESLRQHKKAIRDSIAYYMDMDGDQSKSLYPLFDREAKLQVAINREMYDAKHRIDEVLTPEQRSRLREACRNDARHKPAPDGKAKQNRKR